MSDTDKNPFRAFFNIVSDLEEFADEHKEEIDAIIGKAEDFTVGITEGSQIEEEAIGRRVDDSVVTLTVDMGLASDSRVNVDQEVGETRNAVNIKVDGETDTMAILPDDAKPGKMEWSMNNGVLTVEVPRGDADA